MEATSGQTIKKNVILLLLVVLLAVIPLVLVQGSEFGGADGAAEGMIQEIKKDYEPWASPVMEPPGSETESLLFALQAALGSGGIFYCLGYLKGQRKTVSKEC